MLIIARRNCRSLIFTLFLCLSLSSTPSPHRPPQVEADDSQVAYKEYNKSKVVFRSPVLCLDLRMVVSGENLCGQNDPGASTEDDPFRKEGSNPKDSKEQEAEQQEGSNYDIGKNELKVSICISLSLYNTMNRLLNPSMRLLVIVSALY